MADLMERHAAPDVAAEWSARGQNAMRARDLAAAEAAFCKALNYGETAARLQDLAQVRAMAGDLGAAKQLYLKALQSAPQDAALHCNFARILFPAGDKAGALAELQKAVACDPDYAPGQLYLGIALLESDGKKAARAPLRRAAELMPASPVAHYHYGLACFQDGDLATARKAFEIAVDLKPDYVLALEHLGECYLGLNIDDQALSCFEYILERTPASHTARYGRCMALVKLHRSGEAVAEFRKIATYPAAKYALAVALQADGKVEEAREIFAALCREKPDEARYAQGLGNTLTELGRNDEAYQAYLRAIALAPESPSAYRQILSLGKAYALPAAARAGLVALEAKASDLKAPERAELYYALYRLYDREGADTAAIRSLIKANAAKRGQMQYDEAGKLARLADIAAMSPKPVIRKAAAVGSTSDLPVFIVGMPRSGTTLTEQILASHRDVFGAGEIQDFGDCLDVVAPDGVPDLAKLSDDDIRHVASAYLGRLHQLAPDARRVVNKLPWNFRLVGFIHALLPGAHIIHTMRDPMATCFSCFEQTLGWDLPYCADQTELGHYYHAYQKLMAHWRNVLPDGAMYEVCYETLVADFETEARRLMAFCGLDWDPACLKFYQTKRAVTTASAAQVRQPLYASSVGRWKRYEAALTPLKTALAEGYVP